jgi:hypothetical protein
VVVIDDTHPRLRAKIESIFAAMTPMQRFEAALEMTDFVFAQSMAAIERTAPAVSPLEIALRWSEIHYGRELTTLVRRHLAASA